MPALRPAVLTALLLFGCRKPTSIPLPADPTPAVAETPLTDASLATGADVPAGSLRARSAEIDYAVYYLPKTKADALATIRSLPDAAAFVVVTEAPSSPPSVPTLAILSPPIEKVPPPPEASLKYANHGLDDAQQKAFLVSAQVTGLRFYAPGGSIDAVHARALRLTGELARIAGGLPWDVATRDVFSLDQWKGRTEGFENGVPFAQRHTRIDTYRDGELFRLVTLGMETMGLPDIAVNQVAGSQVRSMATLINLVCQVLAEHPVLEKSGELDLVFSKIKSASARAEVVMKDGAAGRVPLRLTIAEPQEGDADNRLIEIAFPGPPETLQERHEATLSAFFGATDSTKHIRHDGEVLAASAHARANLMKLKPRWTRARPELERLMVKGPFRIPSGGNEWMWLEVTSWEGTTIHGVLDNDPEQIPNLHAGARVAVEESSVFDYMLFLPDGGVEGNETANLLMKQ